MNRILLVVRGCPFCNDAIKVINKINLKLPIDKRIRIVDGFEWEEFGVSLEPIMNVLTKKGFNAYPFLYIDSFVIEPAPTPEQLKRFLTSMLKEEIIF